MTESPNERRWTICTNCWQVIAINGQPNEDRQTTVCSHLRGVEVMPVPSTQPVEDEVERVAEAVLPGDLDRLRRMAGRMRPPESGVDTFDLNALDRAIAALAVLADGGEKDA